MVSSENSRRFLNAYNLIDSSLRVQGDIKRNLSYSEAVRRSAKNNQIVAKYEDKLIDYGRLRNAIVHSSNESIVIAEPHLSVVEDCERIATLVTTPPLALGSVANQIVGCVDYDVKLKDVMEYGYSNGFSNIPIFKDGILIGVSTSPQILEVLGKKLFHKVDIGHYIENTTIESVLQEFSNRNYYAIANSKVTVDKILNMFTENRKLLLVLITKTGSLLEPPLGIITIKDVMDINNMLDDYRL